MLLYRLALRTRLVLCVDDLQWGDLDSAQGLGELLAQPSPPPLLFVGAWRSEDAASSPLLQALARLRAVTTGAFTSVAIETGPLTADDAAALALERLGGSVGRSDAAAQGVARLIARESGGNPMLVEALCLHVDPDADPSALRSTLGGRAASLEQVQASCLAIRAFCWLKREGLPVTRAPSSPITAAGAKKKPGKETRRGLRPLTSMILVCSSSQLIGTSSERKYPLPTAAGESAEAMVASTQSST